MRIVFRFLFSACGEIPYATEQGIISEEQGILPQEEGLPAEAENVAG
jgi:hypothetical protein